MSEAKAPEGRNYTKSHEWWTADGDRVTVGITDHAQSELTDIVFVDLPASGKAVQGGTSMLALESVKTVADVYAPADGVVVEANGELKNHPELVNQDPYGKGWLVRLKLSGTPPADQRLTAEEYRAFVAAGGH